MLQRLSLQVMFLKSGKTFDSFEYGNQYPTSQFILSLH